MPTRALLLALGLLVAVAGGYLALSPLRVAEALHRPHDTAPQMMNLRASWGGSLAGIGAFVAWLPALLGARRPRRAVVLGLLLCSMAGIGGARALGFALDGSPDALQWVWLSAEAALVVGCGLALRPELGGARKGSAA